MRIRTALTLAASAGAAACGSTAAPAPSTLALDTVVSGLASPLGLVSPPGDSRLFVVEQAGRIRIVENGLLLDTPFLDVSDRISAGGERGLLGLAFHPDYAANGRLFVHYTVAGTGDVRISEFRASADPDLADPASETPLLTIPHRTFGNHNGGQLAFGPDGKLYVAVGDGGGGGDPLGNAQNTGALLGKLLRLDVDAPAPYLPSDNPFVGASGARGEIWSYGLRNPWRFSFDQATGDLYVADVGEGEREEVDVATGESGRGRGRNFGWNVMEGFACFNAGACDQTGLTLPVLDYPHQGGACTVIGGYVYRGGAMPELRGTYFYADLCAGWVKSFRLAGGQPAEAEEWPALHTSLPTSFGEDAAGELYIVSQEGTVARIVPAP
ncbi:MAG TPA: PQQ-dependent sugar dehydrogenase [Gemmatimonadales bacterium]|nr:PQQ-dependent sugar dehydrogenase [Gemmatimonadales bacterium]